VLDEESFLSTRKKKKRPYGRKATPASNKRGVLGRWVVLGLAGLTVAAGTFIYYVRYANTDKAKITQSVEAKGNKATSLSRDDAFRDLVGSWRRVDGGYIIDIQRIGANGQMSAAYYNPKSIHVSRAAASLNDGTVSVFIELKDVGYPGSTYTLVYRPQHDILSGFYFQAAVNQTFEVVFVRAG
jgi:hypothetical protein